MGETSTARRRPGGTGRRKIDIKKIENEDSLMVTFSKRRNGLFKKASELCLLSGSEIAIIVFSPRAAKPYVFGHPSSVSVINLFLGIHNSPSDGLVRKHNQSTKSILHHHGRRGLQVLKKPREETAAVANRGGECWWHSQMDHMDLHQLQRFKLALQELRAKVAEKMMNRSVVALRSYMVLNPVMVFEPVLRSARD
ncbi:hypothetical protein FNV43_RR16687 [Rhamnella rubrinervis]|uniref:MADS-box domain-containing protein n=1 Tax=Rhamnella rubrinervis TaxID=2594499 RepID=A0A8K0GZA9_9ROSA|nr:hypothetical protein FNV43_RR16687 [Rhamnella rubrinervis]